MSQLKMQQIRLQKHQQLKVQSSWSDIGCDWLTPLQKSMVEKRWVNIAHKMSAALFNDSSSVVDLEYYTEQWWVHIGVLHYVFVIYCTHACTNQPQH